MAADLADLVRFAEPGVLAVEIGWRGPLERFAEPGVLAVEIGWRGLLERFAEAAEALRGRRINGKAGLTVEPL